jgi:branched-chain amino acid transport system ATP-binding protein
MAEGLRDPEPLTSPRAWLGPAIAVALLAALCLAFPAGYGNLLIRLAAINVLVVCALNLLMGHAGQAFIAVAATFAIGAYASALGVMQLGLPWLVALGFGGALAALFGLVSSLPALRLAGAYLAMVSIAFNVIVEETLVHWQGLTGGPVGLPGIPRGGPFGADLNDRDMALLICVFAVAGWWLVDRIRRSQWGLAIVAMRDSEVAARSLGIDTLKVKAVVFLVATFVIGVAGALYAHSAQYVSPDLGGIFGSILFVLMLVLGGSGTRWGPVIGAVILTMLPQLLTDLQKYHVLALGMILLACVVLMPRGIASVLGRRRGAGDAAAAVAAGSSDAGAPRGRLVAATGAGTLRVEGLQRTFGGIAALADVSLEVAPGTIRGLIGPNGSGKSTLVNVVTGHYAPSAGRVSFGTHRLERMSMSGIARLGVVRTFQTPQLFGELTVRENLEVGQFVRLAPSLAGAIAASPGSVSRTQRARHRAHELAAATGLESVLDQPARELAQGQQRLLEIARALAGDPAVLILDEPAAGLSQQDIRALCELLRRLRTEGLGILLIEHHMEVVMGVCDRITVIDRGEVLMEGTPAEVQRSEAVRRAYLGLDSDDMTSAAAAAG